MLLEGKGKHKEHIFTETIFITLVFEPCMGIVCLIY